MRERGARQERVHARQAALLVQGLRAELHRHAAARHAAAGQGRGGAALPERPVDEPHRQAARGLDAQRAGLDRALRGSVRAEARAGRSRRRGRARRDVALSKKKADKLWVWKARDRATGRLLDWELGGRDKATCERLPERLERWGVRLYCADDWAAYAELIPQGRAPRRQGGDPRDRARPRAAAALAGPVPPPHVRGLPGRAHGRGLDRALRPLRRRPWDRRTPIYASLRPSAKEPEHPRRAGWRRSGPGAGSRPSSRPKRSGGCWTAARGWARSRPSSV